MYLKIEKMGIFNLVLLCCGLIHLSNQETSMDMTVDLLENLSLIYDNYRVLWLMFADVSEPVIGEIFSNYSFIRLIVYSDVWYLRMCDGNKLSIEKFDILSKKPLTPAIKTTNVNTSDTEFDKSLQGCLEKFCSKSNRADFTLDCHGAQIETLRVSYDNPECYNEVYDADLQNNNIREITMQSFMNIFVGIVRLDLRNNPIVTFNTNSFQPMRLLRFLYISFVPGIIDEVSIQQVMMINVNLTFVECSTNESTRFFAWNRHCTKSTPDYLYNYTSKVLSKTIETAIISKTEATDLKTMSSQAITTTPEITISSESIATSEIITTPEITISSESIATPEIITTPEITLSSESIATSEIITTPEITTTAKMTKLPTVTSADKPETNWLLYILILISFLFVATVIAIFIYINY